MLVLRFRRIDSQKKVGVCTLSVLYIVLVTLIPIVGLGGKGTGTNTLVKAIILATYLILFLFRSRFRISVGIHSVYFFLSYLISQLYNIAFSAYPVSIINVFIQVALLFALLFLLPTAAAHKSDIINGIKIYVSFSFIAVIYNLILHFPRYINLSFLTNVYYDMHSFFDNKNTYGMILFVGFVLLFYWYQLCDNHERKKITALICLQFFAIATSMCRTALLCAGVFLLLTFLHRFSERKLLCAIVLGIASVLAFVIPPIREYLLYVLLRVDVDTFREPIVEASIRIWRNNILFGVGEESWDSMLYTISGNSYSHNGFLTVLMTGGLVYFLGYCVMLVHAVKCALQIRKVDFYLGSLFLYAAITMAVYAFYESIVLCEANATNFAFTTAVLIIPQLYYNMIRRNKQCAASE